MPFRVTKTYLVDTDDADEAYELTKIKNDKVDTLSVGQIVAVQSSQAPSPVQSFVAGSRVNASLPQAAQATQTANTAS